MELPTFRDFTGYIRHIKADMVLGVMPSETQNPLAVWLKRFFPRDRIAVDYLHVTISGIQVTTPPWMCAILARCDVGRGVQEVRALRMKAMVKQAQQVLEAIYVNV